MPRAGWHRQGAGHGCHRKGTLAEFLNLNMEHGFRGGAFPAAQRARQQVRWCVHVDGAAASLGRGRGHAKLNNTFGQGSIAAQSRDCRCGQGGWSEGAQHHSPIPLLRLLRYAKLLTILLTLVALRDPLPQGSSSRKEAQPQGQSNGPAAEMIDTNAPRGEWLTGRVLSGVRVSWAGGSCRCRSNTTAAAIITTRGECVRGGPVEAR